VVSEGVETKAQLEILQRLGCNVYQGNYYSKPLTLKDFVRFVINNNRAQTHS
jgi:EAL domain-containing protein (putative c-di-GMP-specific phosphodiesterase class I)